MAEKTGFNGNEIRKTWRPKAGGILSIILGAANIITGAFVALVAIGLSVGFGGNSRAGIAGLPLIFLGVVAIIGGTFSIKRRHWGLALAGAICGVLLPAAIVLFFSPFLIGVPPLIIGVLSCTFIAYSKREFR